MLLTTLLACVMTGTFSGEARGQSLTELWDPSPTENPFPNTGADQGVAMAAYLDSPDSYIFVTGWGTNHGGGTHIVTYKYDADNGDLLHGPVYFPPATALWSETIHKPTSIVVDPDNGDVYIAGYSENGEGDFDYILLKYSKNLVPDGDWSAVSPDPAGVRRYDGGEGDDKAVGVGLVIRDGEHPEPSTVPLVVITGTSRGSSNDDVVTIAYWREDGDQDWLDRYNGPGNGNDEAVEMTIIDITTLDDELGTNIFIGASVWNGSTNGFDIQALRYLPSGGTPYWVSDPYNSTADGNDFCTGVAAFASGPGIGGRLIVIGSTTSDPPATEDTDYVTIALDIEDGAYSQAWGSGVRVWGPGPEKSPDVPTDVSISGNIVWVTGRAAHGEAFDIGVIAYALSNGDEFASALIGSQDDTVDERAVANTSAGQCYITGWVYDPNQDSAPIRLVIYKVSIDEHFEIVVDAQQVFYPEDVMESKATAILLSTAAPDGVFVTGRSGTNMWGLDYVTIKYQP